MAKPGKLHLWLIWSSKLGKAVIKRYLAVTANFQMKRFVQKTKDSLQETCRTKSTFDWNQ